MVIGEEERRAAAAAGGGGGGGAGAGGDGGESLVRTLSPSGNHAVLSVLFFFFYFSSLFFFLNCEVKVARTANVQQGTAPWMIYATWQKTTKYMKGIKLYCTRKRKKSINPPVGIKPPKIPPSK